MEKLKDIVVIYHAQCEDGFGAAYAAWRKFGDEASYIPRRTQEPVPEGLTDKEIYIVDYSYKAPQQAALRAANKSVIVIDHHLSSKEAITAYPDNIHDLNHSGAVLAWRYFHPDTEVPELLRYIEDSDLWKFELEHTREFGAALGEYNHDFETWQKLDENLDDRDHFSKFISLGATIARFEDRLVNNIADYCEKVSFEGHEIYAVNAERTYRSVLGHKLATKNGEEGRVEMAIVYYHYAGKVHCSLRSNGDVDVSKIAEKYGGGGHKNAASMRFDTFADLPFQFVQ